MLDLFHASRDDLIRIVNRQRDELAARDRINAQQQAAIAQLEALVGQLSERIGELEARRSGGSGSGSSGGMPGLSRTQVPVREPRPRTRRSGGYGRKRMTPTERVVHVLSSCPDCGAPLAGGTVKRTREAIELPVTPVVVSEHVYLERHCPDCGRRCVPAPELGGLVVGQRRFGNRLTSLITVMREEARLPVRTIRHLLEIMTGLQISDGSIVAASQRMAAHGAAEVEGLRAAVRTSPVVHADETGWRQDGRNGYIWTFSTPERQLFVHGSRAKTMLTDALGADFGGVLVSDFYGAYTGSDGLHQYCWAHLLRDIHELTERVPDDARLVGWADAATRIFARAQSQAIGPAEVRRTVRKRAERDLATLCKPWSGTPVPQAGLCSRMLRHLSSLFVFVTDPSVPATNNLAERSLRHLVVSRKITGGTRSPTGTATKMTLASLFGTWRVQGINPLDACLSLLQYPQV